MTTIVQEAQFYNGMWFIVAVTVNDSGTRVAPYELELPETATEAELAAAIEAMY